jgi:hypothetical protein
MAKKREELLDYRKISGKIYAIVAFAVSASVRGELLYILAGKSNGPLLSSVCYGIYGVCSVYSYMIFDRYEGRIFSKFRLYAVLSLLLSIAVPVVAFIFPDMLEGFGMTQYGNSISAFSAITVFAAALAVLPSYEFFQMKNLISPYK